MRFHWPTPAATLPVCKRMVLSWRSLLLFTQEAEWPQDLRQRERDVTLVSSINQRINYNLGRGGLCLGNWVTWIILEASSSHRVTLISGARSSVCPDFAYTEKCRHNHGQSRPDNRCVNFHAWTIYQYGLCTICHSTTCIRNEKRKIIVWCGYFTHCCIQNHLTWSLFWLIR